MRVTGQNWDNMQISVPTKFSLFTMLSQEETIENYINWNLIFTYQFDLNFSE